MTKSYYILINSDQLGPYSAADLSGLLSDGVITRLTPLKSDDRDSWFTVGDVLPEPLAQSSGSSSLPAHAPKPPVPGTPVTPKPRQHTEALVVYVSRDGHQLGSYRFSDLNGMLMTTELSPNDIAWHDGMTDWLPLRLLVRSTEKGQSQPSSKPQSASGNAQLTKVRFIPVSFTRSLGEYGFRGDGFVKCDSNHIELQGRPEIYFWATWFAFFIALKLPILVKYYATPSAMFGLFILAEIVAVPVALIVFFCLPMKTIRLQKAQLEKKFRSDVQIGLITRIPPSREPIEFRFNAKSEIEAKVIEAVLGR